MWNRGNITSQSVDTVTVSAPQIGRSRLGGGECVEIIPIICSALTSLGALSAILFSFIAYKRADEKEAADNRGDLTTVIVKLENIGKDTTEIKGDIKEVRSDNQANREAIAKLQQAQLGLEHRMDKIEDIFKKEGI